MMKGRIRADDEGDKEEMIYTTYVDGLNLMGR